MATATPPPDAETRWRHSERLAIVNFHGIGEPGIDVPAAEHVYWCPKTLWREFAEQIAEVDGGAGRRIEITFDDGNLSDVETALPTLVTLGLKASFYVCAGRLGMPGYVSDEDVCTLRDAGMRIGNHGWRHADLRRVPNRELIRETVDSRVRIEQAIGSEITQFAVPFGSYDRRVLRHLKGYRCVMTSDRAPASTTSWLVPRYSFVQGWTRSDIERIVESRRSFSQRSRHLAATMYKRWR